MKAGFHWVAVASWADHPAMSARDAGEDGSTMVAKDDAVRQVQDKVASTFGTRMLEDVTQMALVLYMVRDGDIEEITLDGPQLMVRGQPAAMFYLGTTRVKKLLTDNDC